MHAYSEYITEFQIEIRLIFVLKLCRDLITKCQSIVNIEYMYGYRILVLFHHTKSGSFRIGVFHSVYLYILLTFRTTKQ